jgi:hypothetical protein
MPAGVAVQRPRSGADDGPPGDRHPTEMII